MSLFQFGFRPAAAVQDEENIVDQAVVSAHLPTLGESGLRRVEYNQSCF